MKKIRLGVIGTGLAWERLHYPALQKMSQEYEIVALANRSIEDAIEFAKKINLDLSNVYGDYKEMLQREDIDAIDILVPIEQNYEVSENVAKSGKSFICEKPLAPNMEQAQNYLELSRKYQVKILIAENFRYNEEINKIRDMVQMGKIGEIVYFVQNNVFDFPSEMVKDTFAAKEWRQHPAFFGGTFLDGAIHDIGAMRHIFGAVDKVQAFGKEQKEDYCPYKSIHANILFKDGVIGQYTYFSSGVEAQKPQIGLRIFGSKGSLYLEDKACGIINIFYNDGSMEQIPYTPKQGYYHELMNFYRAFHDEEDIAVTPDVEFGDVKMVFDILKSLKTGEIVEVDKVMELAFYAHEAYIEIPHYVQ